ncbi:MAG: sodium:proton antiporter NhaD [Bacteroidaceae bacterium]|nr:sodium:proton antiporter NhaD [Bacteroidaceae bacterium]
MYAALVVVFVIGYLLIALEHPIKIDKSATALLLGMVMWVLFILGADALPFVVEKAAEHGHAGHLSDFVNAEILHHMGDIATTLFFLIGAMTIVELVDVHGGFSIITDRITSRDKKKLLWILSFVTFFMSAILDNLTTSIVMVLLLRKLVNDPKERWLYASMIIIAANAGGAWSPIGDITTIMLWVKGNVSTVSVIAYIILPSLVAMILPLFLVSSKLKGQLERVEEKTDIQENFVTKKERNMLFYLGVGGLIFVPIFKTITHLPPFIGMLFSLSILWIVTEMMYNNKALDPQRQHRLPRILQRIDTPTILFFLGILMAVAVLQSTGILGDMANLLAEKVGDVNVINIVLGFLSSIVDNVPLVAAAQGMYEIIPVEYAQTLAPGHWDLNFVQDGVFWLLLTYCAGVGGSMLIIGSAAGVVVMGLEKINFGWYLKNISLIAMLGYLAGVAVLIGELMLLPPTKVLYGIG